MTLHEFLQRLWYFAFFPLLEPPECLRADISEEDEGEDDGRFFVWVRNRGAKAPLSPVIVYDRNIGGKQEYIGDLHLLRPHEYGDAMDVLAARYPPPDTVPE